MGTSSSLVVFVILHVISPITGMNHWALNDDGIIAAKIDSPFYMRNPQHLATFIDQIKHNEIVERTYLELLKQINLVVQEINYSERVWSEIIAQFKCSAEFNENVLEVAQITPKYLNRFNRNAGYELLVKPELPYCERYLKFDIGIGCFDHLHSIRNSQQLVISPEDYLRDEELGIDSDYFLSGIIAGLKKNPNSWRHHTLGSYYWRMKGNAHQAVECARRGISLATSEFKDIPLLSLGTILANAGKSSEADIVLSAAVEHAPELAENHLALGSNLAMLNSFNRSIEHLELAEKIDPSLSRKLKAFKEYVMCLDKVNKSIEKVDTYVDYFKREVNRLRSIKNKITASQEKLIQHQVPLSARQIQADNGSGPFTNRGQYCGTRTLGGNDELVLFCDFYSEMQMRLESKSADIEALERELSASSESIRKQLSVELQTKLNLQRMKSKSSRD